MYQQQIILCYLICHYQYQQYITKTKKNHAPILVVPPAYEKPFKSIGKIIINLNPPQDLCTKTQISKFKYQTLMHTLSMPLKYHKILSVFTFVKDWHNIIINFQQLPNSRIPWLKARLVFRKEIMILNVIKHIFKKYLFHNLTYIAIFWLVGTGMCYFRQLYILCNKLMSCYN